MFGHDLYACASTRCSRGGARLGSCATRVNLCARELVESDLIFFIHPNWWPAGGHTERYIDALYAAECL